MVSQVKSPLAPFPICGTRRARSTRIADECARAGAGDYIPANGFIYRPDITFPPPPDPRNAIEQILVGEEEMVRGGMDIKIRLEEQVQVRSRDPSPLSGGT